MSDDLFDFERGTQTALAPPSNRPPKLTSCGFADDEVRELGDRIAALNSEEAKELLRYLEARIGDEASQQGG